MDIYWLVFQGNLLQGVTSTAVSRASEEYEEELSLTS